MLLNVYTLKAERVIGLFIAHEVLEVYSVALMRMDDEPKLLDLMQSLGFADRLNWSCYPDVYM